MSEQKKPSNMTLTTQAGCFKCSHLTCVCPREFWITFKPHYKDPLGPCINVLKPVNDYDHEYGVHVIEYSALTEMTVSKACMASEMQVKYDSLKSKAEKLAGALKNIINPIQCPSCSMENAEDCVPCYCSEEFNSASHIAKKALEEWDAE